MPELYLSPASIGYLAQFILCLAMTSALVVDSVKRKQVDSRVLLVFGFLFYYSTFATLMFLDASLLPSKRFVPLYLQNPMLAVGIVFTLSFIYRFPEKYEKRKWERWILFVLSLAYLTFEIYLAVDRFYLLSQGIIDYRFWYADYFLVALSIWIPVALFRQFDMADSRKIPWFRKIFLKQEPGPSAARKFALIFIILPCLGFVDLLASDNYIPSMVSTIIISMGSLLQLWLLALNYVKAQPKVTSFMFKLTGGSLTLTLIILGSSGWFLIPAYTGQFKVPLPSKESLRFSPSTAGGYDITPIPYSFETDLGTQFTPSEQVTGIDRQINFSFPFFGKEYSTLFITKIGLIQLGNSSRRTDMLNQYGSQPGISPLMINLDLLDTGGIYSRIDEDRLVITWDNLPAAQALDKMFTYQVVLYKNGQIDFNYNDLPSYVTMEPGARTYENVWYRGLIAGPGAKIKMSENLAAAGQSGSGGVVQDYYNSFRRYQHVFQNQLAWLLVFSSALLFMVTPILIQNDIIRPLNALVEGVRNADENNLNMEIPVHDMDEIGLLTQSFNKMVAYIRKLVSSLEERVAARTSELEKTNQTLEEEMSMRQASQEQLIQHQRSIAIMEERERFSRDLHDGLVQVISSISMQLDAAQTLFFNEQDESANKIMENLKLMANTANHDLRSVILGLRLPRKDKSDIFSSLEDYLQVFSAQTGIKTLLNLPEENIPVISSVAEEQVLHIIQESLSNVRKHARANKVQILISMDERSIHFVISDDGIGFDPKQELDDGQEHFGLKMMRERTEIMGGKLEIRSKQKNGTTLLFSIQNSHLNMLAEGDGQLRDLRLLLVDDSPIFLEGLHTMLVTRGLTIVGLAKNGLEAQEKVRSLSPDMVVMDVIMPVCNGIEAALAIKTEFPQMKIVMLTSSEKEEHLFDAIRNGASGFILKGTDPDQFYEALERLAKGETILSPEIAKRLITELTYPDHEKTINALIDNSLSDTQLKIVNMLASKLTYKEIGQKLHFSERTIKYHMKHILDRLHLTSRSELVEFAKKSEAAGKPTLKKGDGQ